MSQLLESPLLCMNYDCQNELSDFELKKVNAHFNLYRLCAKCRRKWTKVSFLRCQRCNERFDFLGNKMRCKPCTRLRKLENNRVRYQK